MLVLNLGNIQATQLVKTTFSDGFGLRFAEVKGRDARHGFVASKNGFELLATGACLAHGHNIVNSVLCLHKPFEDVSTSLRFLQIKRSTSFHHRFPVRDISVNHGRKVEQNRAAVQDTHHVGRIGFLEPTGLEQLVEHSVWVGVVFDLDDDSDAFF